MKPVGSSGISASDPTKNAAVAIIPACLLINEVCRLENLPDIKDVKLFLDILKNMGAEVTYVDKNTVDINCANVQSYEPDEALTAKMRGSSYLIGALLEDGKTYTLNEVDALIEKFMKGKVR